MNCKQILEHIKGKFVIDPQLQREVLHCDLE
jgi:hypothetical protein